MNKVYISLYNKSGIEKIANVLENSGWEIYSSFSTYQYLIQNKINAIEIKTDIHPNLAIISSFSSKKIYKIPRFNLIISDIPQEIEDEIYNLILIITAIRKKIPVMIKDYERFIEQIKIFGKLTENTIEALENEAINIVSYLIANSAFSKYQYLNDKLDVTVLPLKKIKNLKCGENPHQKSILYSTPLKGLSFELIEGELNTNHFFDIKKAIEIMNEIEFPFFLTLNHANISYLIWGKNIVNIPSTIKDNTAVFNEKINKELASHLSNSEIKLIIARDFDNTSINIFKKTSKNKKILVKTPYHIKPPNEIELFYFDNYILIEEKNIYPVTYKEISEKKIENPIYEKIKIGSAIIKYSKTFSCVILSEEELIGYSQGCASSYDALMKAIYGIYNIKKIKLSKRIEKITIILDGPFLKEMLQLITNYPIDIIAASSCENGEEITKILKEKNIILIVSEKRYYKHC